MIYYLSKRNIYVSEQNQVGYEVFGGIDLEWAAKWNEGSVWTSQGRGTGQSLKAERELGPWSKKTWLL